MKGLECAIQMARRVGSLALLSGIVAAGAQAQSPEVDAGLVDQLAAPAPTEVAAPAAEPGAGALATGPKSAQARDLDSVLQKLDRGTAERDLLAVELEVNNLRKELGGNQAGTNQLPQLVGLTVAGSNRWAEFLVGDAMFQVGAGEWVTGEWQVREITPSGVVLRSGDGRKTYTMVLGSGQGVPAARK